MSLKQNYREKIQPKLLKDLNLSNIHEVPKVVKVTVNRGLGEAAQNAKALEASIEELATKLEGVDPKAFLKTIKEWNEAVMTEVPFNPAVKDGRSTRGLAVPKSNWANTIDQAPFEAYAVTCGLTFTFGGLKISTEGEVENTDGTTIPGLFAAGELVGGLFYHNYPGGTGLVSGEIGRAHV